MKKYFFPKYDEVSLFITVLTGVFVLLLHRELIHIFISDAQSDYRTWLIGGFIIYGATICIYHAFSKKKKNYADKNEMAVFSLMVNGFAGIFGFIAISTGEYAEGWLAIFPLWNLLTSLWLFILMKHHPDVGSFIDDRDAEKHELFIGAFAVLIIIGIFEFYLKAPWAITFGAGVGYATMFSNSVSAFFRSEL